ncbi:MAG: DNA internalization-related competence protein ComEC/Rec2 [Kofleriaceae bacterium]|nr:DNA internalization-related competence protein ComEC/Rec2 [Kofleriaceae bacterium]
MAAPAAAARRRACLACAALLGGALAAHERAEAPSLPDGVTVDDRGVDVVTGVVVGPVAALPGLPPRLRLVLDLDGPADARVLVGVEVALAGDVLPGDRVRATGRLRTPRGYRDPGAADRAQIVRDQGADLELTATGFDVIAPAARWSAWRPAVAAQRAASARIAARGGDPVGNAIVRAAVVGDRSAVDDATDDAWRAAGIYHALSVSGMHLAVVALLFFALARRAWAAAPGLALRVDPARVAALAAAPIAIGYTLVTGGQPATIRALVVVLAMLLGAALRRRLAAIDALGVAALLVLVHRPSALADPSLQLSFVAAATLCLTARRPAPPPPGASRRGRVIASARGWVGAALRTSLWITATTAPITAWHFHQVSIGGVVGNVVLAPAIELLVIPLGLAGLALGVVGLGGVLLDAAIAAAGAVAAGAAALGAWIPVVAVPPPRLLEIVAWAAVVAAAWAWSRTRRRGAVAGVAAVAAATLVASIAWTTTIAPARRTGLRVTFLDVGQGDAAVVELPGGATWLIDAGGLPVRPGPGVPPAALARLWRAPGDAVLRFLDARRIRRIDVAVISHPHPDHYLGLLALADRIPIGELWMARPPPGAAPVHDDAMPTFDDVAAALVARGTRVVVPPLGVARRAGGVDLEVLGPRYDDGTGEAPVAAADPVRSVNDDSLVVALGFAGRRILLLGDVEREGEDALVARGAAAADVVKVAHHGSPTSSSAPLVAATGAAWAVVSCGRANRFGFPADDVVARWRLAGARVLRTDTVGAVTVTVAADGALAVATFDAEPAPGAAASR